MRVNVKEISAWYRRCVEQQLLQGYRGYRLINALIYRPVPRGSLIRQTAMFMLNSPLHPKDYMVVLDKVPKKQINPLKIIDAIEMIAMNDILQIKHLIDRAYSDPPKVPTLFGGRRDTDQRVSS